METTATAAPVTRPRRPAASVLGAEAGGRCAVAEAVDLAAAIRADAPDALGAHHLDLTAALLLL